MDSTYRIDLQSGNVFLKNNWVYYVYKINLIEGIFKAVVSTYHEKDKYWDSGLCDWFALEDLKGSQMIGYIQPESESEIFHRFVERSVFLKKHVKNL